MIYLWVFFIPTLTLLAVINAYQLGKVSGDKRLTEIVKSYESISDAKERAIKALESQIVIYKGMNK